MHYLPWSLTFLTVRQRADKHIYLIMEFCSGGDLTNYIKKRGRVEGLEYKPTPDAALTYYPHPRTGGLDEIAVRSFLRQLGKISDLHVFQLRLTGSSSCTQISTTPQPDPSRHKTPGRIIDPTSCYHSDSIYVEPSAKPSIPGGIG